MQKTKRILAMIGVIILIGFYAATIFCALSASENFMGMLMASIYASAVIPALICVYIFLCKVFKKDDDEKKADET